ncbi:MAG: HAD-IB family phosphatase [Anaerolineae bacterium]
MTVKQVILCDFDGTITTDDVTDGLCRLYLPSLREDMRRLSRLWHEGQVSATEYSEYAYGAMNLHKTQVDAYLEGVAVSPGLDRLLALADRQGWEFQVLSSGYSYYIEAVLGRLGLSLPYVANRLGFDGEGRVVVEHLANDDPTCNRYKHPCTGCKPVVWDEWKRRGYRIAFVGDGVSDYCVAERFVAAAAPGDLLFAKAGLRRYCEERAIAALPFETLEDVAAVLERQ